MKMIELIRYYDRSKSQHAPLSPSLAPKVVMLMSVFGALNADASGKEIVAKAKEAWPTAEPGTLLRNLGQLRAVLNVAERDGLIPRAPHISMPFVMDVIDCPITPSEAQLLLDHMRWTEPNWWPLVLLLTHTGARLSEALRVTRSDFGAEGVRITKLSTRSTKTVPRVIPLTSQLLAAFNSGNLDAMLTATAQRKLLTNPDTQPQKKPRNQASCDPATSEYTHARSVSANLGRAIKGACRALGLPEIRVHDLRHVFAALVAERGADLADIATLLGHQTLKSTLRYRGLVRQRARSFLENV